MNRDLEALKKLVPPPKSPKSVGTSDQWRKAERKLGITFPPDYQDVVRTYGPPFGDFYWLWTPAPKPTNILTRLAQLASWWPEDAPVGLHPQVPGLLPWGHDENGNYYFWLTKGSSARWNVVTWSPRGPGFVLHKCSMLKYLLGVWRRKIEPLAGGYPPLNLCLRCPNETCAGWACCNEVDGPWSCDTCGYDWTGREEFDEAVAEVVAKFPYRRKCYVRRRGSYFAAPKENEPANYARLVRREADA